MQSCFTRYAGTQFMRLAAEIGEAAALKLCDQLGGRENVYVPRPGGRSQSAKLFRSIIGEESAEALFQAFGPGRLDFPTSPAREFKKPRIMALILDGDRTSGEIARTCRVSQRYVRRLKADIFR